MRCWKWCECNPHWSPCEKRLFHPMAGCQSRWPRRKSVRSRVSLQSQPTEAQLTRGLAIECPTLVQCSLTQLDMFHTSLKPNMEPPTVGPERYVYIYIWCIYTYIYFSPQEAAFGPLNFWIHGFIPENSGEFETSANSEVTFIRDWMTRRRIAGAEKREPPVKSHHEGLGNSNFSMG